MSKKGSRQSLAELEAIDLDDALDEFPIGLGCALDLFREKDEVFEVLHSLPAIYTSQAAVSLGIFDLKSVFITVYYYSINRSKQLTKSTPE